MKLNDEAVEAATQAAFKFHMGFNMDYRKRTAAPDKYVEYSQVTIINYLKNLDAEGLADLYEYWCRRVEALPEATELRVGDTYAIPRYGWQWRLYNSSVNISESHVGYRVLRRARRQWKIGDLVDDTRDLPDSAIVRDEAENTAEYVAKYDSFTPIGIDALWILDALDNPRIIWLPEEGEK